MTKISFFILALATLSNAAYARLSDSCYDCLTQPNEARITSSIAMDSPLVVEEKNFESTDYEPIKNAFEGNGHSSR